LSKQTFDLIKIAGKGKYKIENLTGGAELTKEDEPELIDAIKEKLKKLSKYKDKELFVSLDVQATVIRVTVLAK